MSNPFFTVITTSFNYGRFVGQTIESVLRQSFPDWELIVVDDCSSDDSWSVVCSYQDSRIRTVRFESNQGACAAYNAGLALARGHFVASLDSDDLFAPEKLACQHRFLIENPDIDICATWLTEVDETGALVSVANQAYEPWFNQHINLNDPSSWVWQNRLCHSSSVVRKEIHDKIGPFREDLVYTPDWNFWLRALVAGVRFGVVEEPLTLYRNHGFNITHRQPLGTINEYAETSASLFHPYLFRCGRLDLIEANLFGFLRSIPFQDASEVERQEVVAKILGLDTGGRVPDMDSLDIIPSLFLAVAERSLGLEQTLSAEREELSVALKARDEQLLALQADADRVDQDRRASEEAYSNLLNATEDALKQKDERLECMQESLISLEDQWGLWVERASLIHQALVLERRDHTLDRQVHSDEVARLEQTLALERRNHTAYRQMHIDEVARLEQALALERRDRAAELQGLQFQVQSLVDQRAALELERDHGLRTLESSEQRITSLTILQNQSEMQIAGLKGQIGELTLPAMRYFRLRGFLPVLVRGALLKAWRIVKRLKE